MDYRWYAAQALAGLEATAIYYLSRAGISAFSPTIGGNHPLRLFPGYIFVELEHFTEAGEVNRTRGIRKLLPVHARDPLPLPFGFVEGLRERIARRDFDESAAEEEVYRFLPKDEVLLKTGPFQDHRGRFVRYRKGAGVVILTLLGGEREVERPLRELAPVLAFQAGPDSRSASGPLAA